MTLKRGFALAAVVAAAAFAASAQTRELNPTVKVLARPQSPVPPECATDQTVLPALEAETPALEPSTAQAPPSSDLRTSLRRLQAAADSNDYAAFKSAFAEAKHAVAAHPAGGERNAANDALQVFADIARVWDYAMASPTGGFFDAASQGGSLLNAMKRYPDYGRSIADQTITSGGRTLYPTPETRHFLARESARRLTRLGVSTPTQVARGTQPEPMPRRTVAAPAPPAKKPVQVATKPPAAKTTAPKKAAAKTQTAKTQTPKKATPKPATKTAKATPPAKAKSVPIKTTPVPKPKPTAPPVKVADTSTMPPASPIVATPQPKTPATTTTASSATQTATTVPITATTAPVTTTTAPPPASTTTTDTTVSTTSSTPTDTAVTAAPDTSATSTAVPPSKQNGNMNLILAVVLILVGIGVLVVLFRASD